MSEESVYVLASVRVVNSPWIVEPLRLTSDAWDMLAASSARFRERCGDGYVARTKWAASSMD
jgi:hypothetical protein